MCSTECVVPQGYTWAWEGSHQSFTYEISLTMSAISHPCSSPHLEVI